MVKPSGPWEGNLPFSKKLNITRSPADTNDRNIFYILTKSNNTKDTIYLHSSPLIGFQLNSRMLNAQVSS